jgi:hypothetical protein
MRFYAVAVSSEDRLPIMVLPFREFRDIRWDRDGEMRVIPSHVIEDIRRQPINLNGPLPCVQWDQCEPLPENRLPVTLNPRPTRS